MRWPFVSRFAFDVLIESRDAWQRQCVAANARAAAAESRYHTLADKLTERAAPVVKEQKKDDLAEVIALRAGADLSLRRHLSAWAQAELRAGKTPTDVQNGILHWQGDGDEDAA